MACSVYCLVSAHEQIEPLMQRLDEAGVDDADITVILRERGRESVYRPLPEAEVERRAASALWALPLASVGLWWTFPLRAWWDPCVVFRHGSGRIVLSHALPLRTRRAAGGEATVGQLKPAGLQRRR